MCLAVPGKVVEIVGAGETMPSARVAFAGVLKDVSLALLPEARVDDFVLVHAGFAIARVEPDEAARTGRTIDALDALARERQP